MTMWTFMLICVYVCVRAYIRYGLMANNPTAMGVSRHRLFISAFMNQHDWLNIMTYGVPMTMRTLGKYSHCHKLVWTLIIYFSVYNWLKDH